MQDRPTQDELLAALERFLDEQVVARTEGALRFNGRVAANVVRMLRRELEGEGAALEREWAGLDALLGAAVRPEALAGLREALVARNEALCERIRSGGSDWPLFRDAAIEHVRETVRDKLLVTNPGWLEAEADR
jgi:hypothetical protein